MSNPFANHTHTWNCNLHWNRHRLSHEEAKSEVCSCFAIQCDRCRASGRGGKLCYCLINEMEQEEKWAFWEELRAKEDREVRAASPALYGRADRAEEEEAHLQWWKNRGVEREQQIADINRRGWE